MKVRLCKHNQATEYLEQQLVNVPDIDVKVKSCLKQCKACKKHPVALLDKQLFSNQSSGDLASQLLAIIHKTRVPE